MYTHTHTLPTTQAQASSETIQSTRQAASVLTTLLQESKARELALSLSALTSQGTISELRRSVEFAHNQVGVWARHVQDVARVRTNSPVLQGARTAHELARTAHELAMECGIGITLVQPEGQGPVSGRCSCGVRRVLGCCTCVCLCV